ncbi:MAG: flagellar basal-body rod protein FlgG [Ramlibacter sp.]|uniref:flagellar basal-body rod protein FlgG n=1 Tax=Ramlibacter sp. TaxID=1917967 RepID=UPI002636E9D8|nr:flagellar basal-body rod protein FlgG [Ramlibacter sp.]MDH4376690.1 flagellar basal-body rod protein FlgG [Ramlibacter sp.]
MDASMWIAKTGLDAQQTRMAVISNNLANVNTTGFKRDRATFEDMLYQNVRQPGAQLSANAQAPTGLMLGTGVRLVATEKTHVQGSLVQTKGALDLAIQGEGFFQVTQADNSIAYTRDGAFKKSATGQLVTATGQPVFPVVQIPQNAASITVSQDGIVSVELTTGGAQQIAQLTIARFNNPAGLQAMGQNLLRETPASGAPQPVNPGAGGAGTLAQGAVEASNVNVVEEMVNMIETQRAYEINSKAISAVDGMLKFLNNNL